MFFVVSLRIKKYSSMMFFHVLNPWFMLFLKSRIQETKHLLNNAGSSTDQIKPACKAKLAGTKELKKCVQWFYTLYMNKVSNLRPLLSNSFPQGFQKYKMFGHWTSESAGKKTFKRREQMKKKICKKLFFATAILHP